MTAQLRLRRPSFGFYAKIILLVSLALWMIPEVYMVSVSLRPADKSFDPSLFVLPITFDNFTTVIHDNPLLKFFWNSLVITIGTVLMVLAAASTFAYAASILRLNKTTLIYTILLTTLMVPVASIVLPLGIMLHSFGWINSYQGLILPYAALGIPYAIVIIKAFMDDSPRDLFDAAMIDGCTTLQMFLHVALPLVKPALIFVGIWQFIVTWNEFFLALVVLTDSEHKTVTLIPMQYSGMYMANPGALFAILVIIALPLVLLYILVQRYFIAGLLSGAVKG
ncbi:MAG: carbohydrate ABC transporter permease [Verrucomicrobia bacterium]|nr:carbohydrate ABC transporter permease [Verrucomicrobiota bacterium]MBV9643783.1 carbohydrate ABC transporter permease [Verrucomicrobiota bacterium]